MPEASLQRKLCICRDPDCTVPYGLCHCGCGGKTRISHQNHTRDGHIKGEPYALLRSHKAAPKLEDAVPFKIDGVPSRIISLTQNLITIVDADDYPWLMRHHWHARWCPRLHGFYASTNLMRPDGRWGCVQMGRLILGLEFGDPRIADHIDPWATLENRRKNLRIATKAESAANRRIRSDNKTGYKGVSIYRGKILVNVSAYGHAEPTIEASSLEEGSRIYWELAAKRQGEFARLK